VTILAREGVRFTGVPMTKALDTLVEAMESRTRQPGLDAGITGALDEVCAALRRRRARLG
jgi:hypothetical protein